MRVDPINGYNNAVLVSLREENERLKDRIFDLEKMMGITWIAPAVLKLSKTENTILGLLMHRPYVDKEAILTALYAMDENGGPDPQVVGVWIYRLRRIRLEPFGIKIGTIHGIGWTLTEENKEIVNRLYSLGGNDRMRRDLRSKSYAV